MAASVLLVKLLYRALHRNSQGDVLDILRPTWLKTEKPLLERLQQMALTPNPRIIGAWNLRSGYLFIDLLGMVELI